jgi:hypothetical protein
MWKHTINAGHQGKPPNLHQTISPGSYRSALVSAESTDCEGFAFDFIGVCFVVLAVTVGSIAVSSVAVAAGLSNINCGSCCFERRGRLIDGDSKVRTRDIDDWSSYIPVDGCSVVIDFEKLTAEKDSYLIAPIQLFDSFFWENDEQRIWRVINWLAWLIDQSDKINYINRNIFTLKLLRFIRMK